MIDHPRRIHLFDQPSFLKGVARLLDWRVSLSEYNISPSPRTADYYAILSDWQAVGDDMWDAIDIVDEAIEQEVNE